MPLIKKIQLAWLSPEEILKKSFGNISNSGTIDPKNLKPKLGGLFDPRIFGPFNNYECYCGKYKIDPNDPRQRPNINKKCEEINCGVVVGEKNLQRWRMGHINLPVPITNIFLFSHTVPLLSKLLNISPKNLKEIVYLQVYIVLDNGLSTIVKKGSILEKNIDRGWLKEVLKEISQKEDTKPAVSKQADKLIEELTEKKEKKSTEMIFIDDYLNFLKKQAKMKISTGSEAFCELLKKLDGEELKRLEKEQKELSSDKLRINKEKIRILRNFLKNGIKLERMVMYYLPVIPCGLRPAVALADTNTIATTRINILYQGIIFAINSLTYLLESPVFISEIVDNAKRRLQESVDQLLYKSQNQSYKNQKKSSTKSIAQLLEGKEGLRRYSLGKRVDYSARAVIVPGVELTLNQVGLPIKMLLTLYEPFLIGALLKKKLVASVKEGKKLITSHDPLIFPILNQEIIPHHPVLINRAPTLHRPSLLSSYPIPCKGNVIRLHPLITTGLNADFDGDQMPVHLPLTPSAQEEARTFLLPVQNILDPKNGQLIIIPTKDMTLGIYWLTSESKAEKPYFFYNLNDIWKCYEKQQITLQDLIIIPTSLVGKNLSSVTNKFFFTTPGKLLFNEILPTNFPFYLNNLDYYNTNFVSPYPQDIFSLADDKEMEKIWQQKNASSGWKKKDMIIFLNGLVSKTELEKLANFLDKLKNLAFSSATRSGISISLFELNLLEIKKKELIIAQTKEKILQIDDYVDQGFFSKEEAKEKKLATWGESKNYLEKVIMDNLKINKKSSLYQIWESGARINSENLTQIFAMVGNIVNYKGEIIETPVISSLLEGLDQFEFPISARGTVYGMINVALSTAEAGYLTRRLVEAVQNIIISSEDCQTTDGDWKCALIEKDYLTETETMLIPLKKRVYGLFLINDLTNQKGEVLLAHDTFLLEKEIKILEENKITTVLVRSPFYCKLKTGICQKCYGLDLSKGQAIISIGTAAGIIAAQSLGEPGTQLTMRTFHTGGVRGEKEDIVHGLPKVKEIFDNITPKIDKKIILTKISGEIVFIEKKAKVTIIKQKGEKEEITYSFPTTKSIKVQLGQIIEKGKELTTGKIDLNDYLEVMGRDACQGYIVKEIWKVYFEQGIDINQKHIELFVRQMLSKVKIVEIGDSEFLEGEIVDYEKFHQLKAELKKNSKKVPIAKNIILGLKQIINYSSSFLAAISFQNTLKNLAEYSWQQPIDYLQGLKESLIAGQLAPVGKGFLERQKYSKKS